MGSKKPFSKNKIIKIKKLRFVTDMGEYLLIIYKCEYFKPFFQADNFCVSFFKIVQRTDGISVTLSSMYEWYTYTYIYI